ncbi:MAG: helix-hairpin-helix domain-containing protein [Thermoguttaceae bacterium]|jgi:Holliday junction DNA helicase RuvA|nr:helix-hairpin-helix domain-containing protein [Thermoguttaceae bacterium]
MIVKISGKLVALFPERAILEAGAFEYETLVPEFTRRQLQGEVGNEVSLHTIEYLDGNMQQGRLTPRLVGFLTEVEREFFELFCSVDGLGSKKALRAMVRPVREIAAAIEEQDVKFLSQLPGIGPATAERIVAKLRRKVPKFALMVARPGDAASGEGSLQEHDVVTETFEALVSLGHGEAEARRMIDSVVEGSRKKFKDSSELIQEIYLKNR